MNLDEAKLKIAKLIRLGENQGSAENESETAMRQAEALMRKYNLSRAEILMKDGEVKYTWEAGFYGFGRPGKPVSKVPVWFQGLSVAVARFTDTLVSLTNKPELGAGLSFRGEAQDVVLALWFIDYLKDAIRRATRDAGLGSSSSREDFRKVMAWRLSMRLKELREARNHQASDPNCRALVLVTEDKLKQRDAKFGGENYRSSKSSGTIKDPRAYQRGIDEANKVQLNKPLTGFSNNDRLRSA